MIQNKKRKMTIVEKILIYSLIIVCSFQGIFAPISSYLDEIILLLLLFYETLFHYVKLKEKIKIKNIFPLILFVVITIPNIFLKEYDGFAYFYEIINYLKIPLILFLPMYFNFEENELNKILKFFLFINIISALEGIYHFTFYEQIGYRFGDKFRNGLYRPTGLSGHPISLGFSCLINFLILNNLKRKKLVKGILYFPIVLILFYTLYLTQDRLPLFLIFLYILIKIVELVLYKVKDGITKILPLIISLGVIITSFIIFISYDYVMDYLSNDFNNTIRMYSLKKSGEVFQTYPILGTGIGTFGSSASIKYNSYVYDKFDIKIYENEYASIKTSSNVYESFFAKLLIETGLFGIIMYLYLIKRLFRYSRDNIDIKYIIFCIIIYSFLNSIYQIPFILGNSILISENRYKDTERDEKKNGRK